MLIVEIQKGDSIEAALKKLKSKVKKTKMVEELRERKQFDKPSVKKRETKKNAVYIQKKYKSQEE